MRGLIVFALHGSLIQHAAAAEPAISAGVGAQFAAVAAAAQVKQALDLIKAEEPKTLAEQSMQ